MIFAKVVERSKIKKKTKDETKRGRKRGPIFTMVKKSKDRYKQRGEKEKRKNNETQRFT